MKTFKRILKALGMILLIVLLYVIIAGIDSPQHDFSDLSIPAVVKISPEDNGYEYYIAATNLIYFPTNFASIYHNYSSPEPTAESIAKFKNLLEQNADFFQTIDGIVKYNKWQVPEYKKNIDLFYYVSNLLEINKILFRKADYEKSNKEYEKLFQTLNTIIHLNRLVQNNCKSLTQFLISETGMTYSRRQLLELALNPKIPRTVIKSLSSQLPSPKNIKTNFTRIIKTDNNYTFTAVNLIKKPNDEINFDLKYPHLVGFKKTSVIPYLFQANKTKNLIGEKNRNILANINLAYIDINLYDDKEFFTFKVLLKPNCSGKAFFRNATMGKRQFQKKCEFETQSSVLQLTIALAQYQIDNDNLPDSLEELIPNYIDSIPIDYFDGKPLKYNKDKQIIYSVNENLTDDGGSKKSTRRPPSSRDTRPFYYKEDAVFTVKLKEN